MLVPAGAGLRALGLAGQHPRAVLRKLVRTVRDEGGLSPPPSQPAAGRVTAAAAALAAQGLDASVRPGLVPRGLPGRHGDPYPSGPRPGHPLDVQPVLDRARPRQRRPRPGRLRTCHHGPLGARDPHGDAGARREEPGPVLRPPVRGLPARPPHRHRGRGPPKPKRRCGAFARTTRAASTAPTTTRQRTGGSTRTRSASASSPTSRGSTSRASAAELRRGRRQGRTRPGLRASKPAMFLWCASTVPPPISSRRASRHRRETTYSPT